MERIIWNYSEVLLIMIYNYPGRVIVRTLQLFPLLGKKWAIFVNFRKIFLVKERPLNIFRWLVLWGFIEFDFWLRKFSKNHKNCPFFPINGKSSYVRTVSLTPWLAGLAGRKSSQHMWGVFTHLTGINFFCQKSYK